MTNRKRGQSKQDLKIIKEAIEFNDDWMQYYSENNRLYHYDVRFVFSESGMWETEQKREYELLEKPCFSFNLLIKYINNIVSEYAYSIPDPKVSARLDTKADPTKIKIIEGMLNKIDLESRGDIVKQTALECALCGGYGARRIVVVRERENSFNHEIKYLPVVDPTKCCWDVEATDVDKGDGAGCLQKERFTMKKFKSMYPTQPEPQSFDGADMAGDGTLSMTEDYVWIADYYRKEYFDIRIHLLSDGQTITMSDEEAEEHLKLLNAGTKMSQKITIERSETCKDYKIMYYKLTRDRILDRAKWDGKKLPLLFQPGIIKLIDGRETTISFVRFVKDAQRLYNWARSENAFRISIDRYERIMAPEHAIEGHENQWKEHWKAKQALIYKEIPGRSVPQALPRTALDPGIQLEMEQSLRDISGITGRYDANVGEAGNEISAVAIDRRQFPSNRSVRPFFQNAELIDKSMYFATLDLLPKIYDTTRQVMIKEKNGTYSPITINGANGTENTLDGDFNVVVKAGPSFEVQQRESVAFLLQWKQSSPELGDILNPVIADNLNIRGAEMIKEGIRARESQPPSPNPEIQLQQMQLQLENQKLQLDNQRIKIEQFESITRRITAEGASYRDKATGEAAIVNAEVNAEKAKVAGAQTAHNMSLQEEKAAQEGLRSAVDLFRASK